MQTFASILNIKATIIRQGIGTPLEQFLERQYKNLFSVGKKFGKVKILNTTTYVLYKYTNDSANLVQKKGALYTYFSHVVRIHDDRSQKAQSLSQLLTV